jgi:phosphatidylserine decarboxylase
MFTSQALLEARGPILVLGVLAVAGILWYPILAWIALALLIAVLLFFRDPARHPSEDPRAIVSPADGTVVEISPAREEEFLKSETIRISVFLSVFDVHVQRAPIEGEIRFVRRERGSHLDARDPRSGAANESRTVGIQAPDGFRVGVRQIAGKVARRIVGWEERGAVLAKGQRIGMIRFGSRVELYLPPETEITVKTGQHVRGGETIIARRR